MGGPEDEEKAVGHVPVLLTEVLAARLGVPSVPKKGDDAGEL